MTPDAALKALADRVGIFPEYRDLSDTVRPTSPETQRALLRANGLAVETASEVRETLSKSDAEDAARLMPPECVVPSRASHVLDVPAGAEWTVVLESGEQAAAGRSTGQVRMPPLPSGVHELQLKSGALAQTVLLIAAPPRLPGLETLGVSKAWGVVGTIYGLRSERDFGLGDYSDLGDISSVLGHSGAAFYGINPVHALGWNYSDTVSPYSPSHRAFLNAGHLAPDLLAEQCGCLSMAAVVAEASGPVEALRGSEVVDYAGHDALLRHLLERLFTLFETDAPNPVKEAFQTFCSAEGQSLSDFALFEALSETLGPDWRSWPDGAQDVARQEPPPLRRLAFHKWLQWLSDRQLDAAQQKAIQAGMPLGLYLDLAVGARLGGAESWCEQGSIADGVSIGAPPDHLSPAGQNWNLTAYAPRKLAQKRYAPFRHMVARIMRHCGLLRIDHALGLTRSYWIPDDGSPGGYIRQPFEIFAALIAIEAERANTLVVGEDLGLVPDGLREQLDDLGFYGYSVLQFEKTDGVPNDPASLRPRSLACFGTHDTPTLRGFYEGVDIDWWARLGWIAPEEKPGKLAERARDVDAFTAVAPPAYRDTSAAEGFRDAMHATLAHSPAALVAVQLDDVLGERQAQNIPSTTTEHPNWLRRSPLSIKDIESVDGLKDLRAIMQDGGRPAEAAAGEAKK